MSADYLFRPEITGPVRIDALAGHEPRWRHDHGDAPIYDSMIAELGPPGMLAGPAPIIPAGIKRGGRRARY